MTPLYAMLHRWSATEHVWGEADCMTSVCDWLVFCGWPDPMADLRGCYDSAASCQRLTGFIRDPLTVTCERFGAVGLRRGNDLRVGDVAVIRRRDDPAVPLGALWTGVSWAAKGLTGTATINAKLVDVLAFWSVGYDA